MERKTSVSDAIEASGYKAKYDTQVKWILSNKPILAWILKETADELKGLDIDTIMQCIEGEPQVSSAPVNPGKFGLDKITGMNTESKVPGEGEIFYDILFHVITPDKQPIKLIINLEAQKKYHTSYDLVTRGIFYCARLLSSQLNTEFTAPDYDDIKKVYSIWICMDTPKYAENTITKYEMEQKKVLGSYDGEARYDLLSTVMVCLGKNDVDSGRPSLHGLLSAILSNTLEPKEKEEILYRKYQIPMTERMKEEMNVMCNLSDLVEERAMEKGMEKGKLDILIQLVREHILSVGDAARRIDMPESEFKKLI